MNLSDMRKRVELALAEVDTSTANEALITFGGKSKEQFGNVVIMAGGGGSGKSIILNNLVSISGKVFDVDALKKAATRSKIIRANVKAATGVAIDGLDMSDPENTSLLHSVLSDAGLPDRSQQAMVASVMAAHPDRKPNLIFDVTLKSLTKLEQIGRMAEQLGYAKDRIHIVWVVNTLSNALKQNASRSRRVHNSILRSIFAGVAGTMYSILTDAKAMSSFANGSLTIVFNRRDIDNTIKKSGFGGKYISAALYVNVKKVGQPITTLDKLDKSLLAKLKEILPDTLFDR